MMTIITPEGGTESERSEAEFVSRIASEVFVKVESSLKPVLERIIAFNADGAFKAYRTREACNLTGLRLLQGRGGYPCASSLQRYAIHHRKHW